MDKGNKKFLRAGDPTRLLIANTSMEDAGYYKCVATFLHKGKEYNVTRNIELRVKSKYLTNEAPAMPRSSIMRINSESHRSPGMSLA